MPTSLYKKKQPTSPPTPPPTNSPLTAGMGYCSDDAGRQCSATTDCICGGASASPPDQAASSSSTENIFDRTRRLQDCNHPKAKDCNNDANCQWNGGNGCGAIPTLPPTTGASDSPSKSQTNSPTKQPTSSPTEQPTSSPTANVS